MKAESWSKQNLKIKISHSNLTITMACVYFCYKLYVTVVKIHCTENKCKTFSILIDIVNSINTPRNQYYYWKSPLYLKIEKKSCE